jgi:hypothetical protein
MVNETKTSARPLRWIAAVGAWALLSIAIRPVVAAPAYVQSNAATPQTANASVSLAYTAAQAAGDLNVVVVGWNDTTATIQSVTDTRGNVYQLAVGPATVSGASTQSIYREQQYGDGDVQSGSRVCGHAYRGVQRDCDERSA